MKNRLLESLDRKIGSKIPVRRYALSDMISESYKTLYECNADSNMHKLVESHIDDVRKNPGDIEKLSRQLSIIKELSRMIESSEISDEDIDMEEPEEDYASNNVSNQLPGSIDNFLQDIAQEFGTITYKEIMDHNYTPEEIQQLRKLRIEFLDIADFLEDDDPELLAIARKVADIVTRTGKTVNLQKSDESSSLDDEEFSEEDGDVDDYHKPEKWQVSGRSRYLARKSKNSPKKPMDESEDTELTEEEVEELSKHLAEIRKNKKPTENCSECDEPVKESKGRKLVKRSIAECDTAKKPISEAAAPKEEKTYIIVKDRKGKKSETNGTLEELIKKFSYTLEKGKGYEKEKGNKKIDTNPKTIKSLIKNLQNAEDNAAKDGYSGTTFSLKESVTPAYDNKSLSEFAKKSSGKAFMKTFKKLDPQLHEGTALTRQDSISLYKAANSAMTQLSVELEHNPEFLTTFKESTALLSADVSKLMESLSNDKAPSKKVMKSLAKFSEALLSESEEVRYPNGQPVSDIDLDKALDYNFGTDRDKDNSKFTTAEKQKSVDYWIKKTDKMHEAEDEEDLPDVEEDDIDNTDDPEDSEETEEVDDFDQEYADARVELHKDLVADHADDEDPDVQDKLEADKSEVMSLPGITDDQIAELHDEDPSEGSEEGEATEDAESSEEPIEGEDGDDITDDELEELKKHLTEMRKARKSR